MTGHREQRPAQAASHISASTVDPGPPIMKAGAGSPRSTVHSRNVDGSSSVIHSKSLACTESEDKVEGVRLCPDSPMNIDHGRWMDLRWTTACSLQHVA